MERYIIKKCIIRLEVKNKEAILKRIQKEKEDRLWQQLEDEFKQSDSDSLFLRNVIKLRSVLFGITYNKQFIHENFNYCHYPIVLVELSPYEHCGRVLLVNKHYIETDECLIDCGMATHCAIISHDLKEHIIKPFDRSRYIVKNSKLILRENEFLLNPLDLLMIPFRPDIIK